MFQFLFGRALMRWLERLGETPPEEKTEPTSEVHLEAPTPQPPEPSQACGTRPSPPKTGEGEPEVVYPRAQRGAMGSLFEVYLAGTDRGALVGAAEEALDEVERLERQLSHYREDSDIARLNRYAA